MPSMCMCGWWRHEGQDVVESKDAEEVTMSKITKDLFSIPMCLAFYSIDSEETLKNFK